jgi:hypothetical protein
MAVVSNTIPPLLLYARTITITITIAISLTYTIVESGDVLPRGGADSCVSGGGDEKSNVHDLAVAVDEGEVRAGGEGTSSAYVGGHVECEVVIVGVPIQDGSSGREACGGLLVVGGNVPHEGTKRDVGGPDDGPGEHEDDADGY